VCGVGPVEAAAATARELALRPPDAVVNVGVAGGRGITPGGLVIGSAAVYVDISAAEIPIVDRVEPIPPCSTECGWRFPTPSSSRSERAEPWAVSCRRLRVEAMEGFGVLRACELAGIPAVEIRAISNELGESDRAGGGSGARSSRSRTRSRRARSRR
jgi:nucleoside phosphorylase